MIVVESHQAAWSGAGTTGAVAFRAQARARSVTRISALVELDADPDLLASLGLSIRLLALPPSAGAAAFEGNPSAAGIPGGPPNAETVRRTFVTAFPLVAGAGEYCPDVPLEVLANESLVAQFPHLSAAGESWQMAVRMEYELLP